MNSYSHYYYAIRYLEGLSNLPLDHEYLRDTFNQEIYLKRTRYFLNLLGNPHKGCKYIHVTGTSGKGTVASMIHNVLHFSGKKVGLVTSPFVQETIEKIKVNDLYISPADFARLVNAIKPAIDKAYQECPYGRPSYFEILLGISFLYFKEQKCKWIVLEVGCGGRFDYTNIIDRCEVAVITNIGYDHMEFLGKTLTKIAYEKAGIIKRGAKVVTSEHRPHLLKIFKDECVKKKAMLIKISSKNGYKKSNELLVSAVCKQVNINPIAFKKSIAITKLPARFEIVSRSPLTVLDGAHNVSKIQSTVLNIKKISYRKLILIFGSAANKDYESMLVQLAPITDYAFFTRSQVVQRHVAHPRDLFRFYRNIKRAQKAEILLDPFEALRKAIKIATDNDLIVVTGSFYLAGDLRRLWFSTKKVLKTRKSF